MMNKSGGTFQITVVGCGTAGSCILEQLARQGVTEPATLIIVDPDQVEAHNLYKSALFTRQDIGQKKAQAVADHLRQINPEVQVIPLCQPIETLRAGLFRTSDLVIGAVDNRLAKFQINRACRAAGTPHLLLAELEGGDSPSARLRCFSPGAAPQQTLRMECAYAPQDYALLNYLRRPCGQAPAPANPELLAHPGRLSPAWRLASEVVEEVERCLAGHPALAPGQELRLLPAQRRYLPLRAARKPDCLCAHAPTALQLELEGSVAEFTVGDLIRQVSLHLGAGWAWQPQAQGWVTGAFAPNFPPGADLLLGAAELAPLANCRLAELWPAGDLLRLSRVSGEIVWAGLPLAGLQTWLAHPQGAVA